MDSTRRLTLFALSGDGKLLDANMQVIANVNGADAAVRLDHTA